MQAPRVVLDRVFLERVVGLALAARVAPAERRLDAVAGVVGKGQADRARGRDRQQVRIAQALRADLVLERLRQARREGAARQVQIGIEQRERAALAREIGRRIVRGVAHQSRDARRFVARGRRVVAQAEHHQRITQAGEAEPDAALGACLFGLLRQRPHGGIEHVVEHAHRDLHHLDEGIVAKARAVLERRFDEEREIDRTEAAAAIGRQRLLAARVGGIDALAVAEVVVGVDAVDEEHARLGMVVGRTHDLVPQLARARLAVDPQPVVAAVGAGRLLRGARLGAVHQLDLAVFLHRAHERIGHTDRDVEVAQLALVLGVDEVLHVGVVAAQHAHLRAAPAARALHRFAAAVEHAHVAHRTRRARLRGADPGTLGPDAREVVAHAAAAAHGLGGFGERGVDAGVALFRRGDRIAHRLHEAVDQGGAERGAGGRIDAAGGDEAAALRIEEARFPQRAQRRRLDRGERTRDARTHVVDAALVAFGVLLQQHLVADGLFGQRDRSALRGGVGHRRSRGHVG